jgi:membrane fusion protein, copper/silver efflux system
MKLRKSASVLLLVGLFFVGLVVYEFSLRPWLITSESAAETGKASPETVVDPSSWGISEGEAATRRHMKEGLAAGHIDPVTGRKILYYQDPMMPGNKFETPGKSPYMDMMLVPVYSAGSTPGIANREATGITIDGRIKQNMGMRTVVVEKRRIAPEITAVGTVVWNERDQVDVQARALGYVEKLHVTATFDGVERDQPLLDLYVPDWVAVQEEFLLLRSMKGADLDRLLDAARSRMRQVGMNEQHIHRLESTGELQPRLTVSAPASGVVTSLMAREGMTVTPGSTLVKINDLTTVWAHAEVPESQIALIKPGDAVSATSPAFPNVTFTGQVQALLPNVNPETRTVTVRMELDNLDHQLFPGMFVDMHFVTEATDTTVLIPSEALIRTGKRTLVMVAEEGGQFRPTEVVIGREFGDQVQISKGLWPGERVVVSGQFLVDSEASLRGVEARLGEAVPVVAEPDSDIFHTSARIEAVGRHKLTLSHDAIPRLQWPAMTMDFELAPELRSSARVAELVVGQEIEINFRRGDGGAPQVIEIRESIKHSEHGGDQ